MGQLERSAALFPFDYRFRIGPAELVISGPSDALTVDVLIRTLKTDPNEPILLTALMLHQYARGDRLASERTFRRMYQLAGKSELMRAVLASREP